MKLAQYQVGVYVVCSVCRTAWWKDRDRSKRSPIFTSKEEGCTFFVKDLFVLSFFFFLPLRNTEDEKKFYKKHNFLLGEEKRVKPVLVDLISQRFPNLRLLKENTVLFCAIFCHISPVEDWVGGMETTKRAWEILGYCKSHMYVWASRNLPVSLMVLQQLWLLCWGGHKTCTKGQKLLLGISSGCKSPKEVIFQLLGIVNRYEIQL